MTWSLKVPNTTGHYWLRAPNKKEAIVAYVDCASGLFNFTLTDNDINTA